MFTANILETCWYTRDPSWWGDLTNVVVEHGPHSNTNALIGRCKNHQGVWKVCLGPRWHHYSTFHPQSICLSLSFPSAQHSFPAAIPFSRRCMQRMVWFSLIWLTGGLCLLDQRTICYLFPLEEQSWINLGTNVQTQKRPGDYSK